MVTCLVMIVANAIAIQCIGYDCFQFPLAATKIMFLGGAFELIFEVRGFIKIYKRKDKE